MMKKIAAGAAVIAGCAALAAPASAAPLNAPGAEVFTLVCDNGRSYDVVVPPGTGEWTPGIILNGRGVVVPFAFTDFRAEVTFPDGTTEVFTEPDSFKGKAKHRNLVACSLSQSFTDPDGTTGTFTGTVLAKIAGR